MSRGSRKKPSKRPGRRKAGHDSRARRWLRRLGLAALVFVATSFALVLPLNWIDPPTTAFMLADGSGREPILHEWVDWEEMGRTVALAAVAAEDQRFADHFGLDFVAIRRAVSEQDERGYLRGASTISQQTVKNLYLWSGRSFVRKGLEAWLTLVAEVSLSKRRILEIYLNVAEFGPGIYGVGAASRHYFGRAPAALSEAQAAMLVSVLPSPRRLSVTEPSAYLRERQVWIRSQMQRLEREAWLRRIDQ